MKKKTKIILGLSGLCALCLGLSACAAKTEIDRFEEQGYTVSVTYDANGGEFLNNGGVTIVDMFRPSDYTEGEDGKIHIKLMSPTSSQRPTSSGHGISCGKPNNFLVGWYQEKEVRTDADGNVVDDAGNVLEERDGVYYYSDTDTTAQPAYIYSGYWDFEKDTLDYSEEDGKVDITLYAGWVPYYEFNYYYKNSNDEWTLYDTTSFDYQAVNAEGSFTSDADTIWVPEWEDGAMDYQHTSSLGTIYNFPHLDGTTFSAAYTDEACKNRIDDSFTHPGGLDIERGIAINRVQNIYVELLEGERYRIEKAEQLVKHPNAKGYYEILGDLDFTGLSWPVECMVGEFTGKMYAPDGQTYKMKNIKATYTNTELLYGGLFGKIGAGAEIRNLAFENATFDISEVGTRMQNAMFGLFAGNISEDAKIENVKVDGLLRIGKINLGTDYSLNLLANGDRSGIERGDIRLQIYGQELISYYYYTVDPTEGKTKVNGEGNVELTFVTLYRGEEPYYDIEY